MTAPAASGDEVLSTDAARRLDAACNAFEAAWIGGGRPRIEEFLGGFDEPERPGVLRELVQLDAYHSRRAGDLCRADDYRERFPGLDPRWLAGVVAPDAARGSTIDAPDRAADTLTVSPTRFGDYELLAEIARGGMGVVYRARQVSLNRPVAVKMILSGQFASPAEVQRFRSEAEAAAALDHPSIVPIYEVGERDGRHYFTMKLVDGPSLAGFRRDTSNPRLSHREAVRLVATVARAVHYAHQHGILHRDLKPANVLLAPVRSLTAAPTWTPVITDFGLAKRVEGADGPTLPGAIVGTPAYMAPEQSDGRGRGLTTAVDVWALGAILYELLTGRPPFQAATALDTLLKVRLEEPVPPRRLCPATAGDLETICLKCLRKGPAERYASAAALADDLECLLAGEPIAARPAGRGRRAALWVRRNKVAVALSAFAAVTALTLVGLVVGLWYGRRLSAAKTDLELANARLGSANESLSSTVQRAEDLKAAADALRGRAEASELAARRLLYLNEFRWAESASRAGRFAESRAILDRLRPADPQARDFRGFEWSYLDKFLRGGVTLEDLDELQADAVVLSEDGREIAVDLEVPRPNRGFERQFRVHRADTGVEVATWAVTDRRLRLHGVAGGRALALTPEGEVWVADGQNKKLRMLRSTGGAAIQACLSADGTRVCTVSRSKDGSRLIVRNVATDQVGCDIPLEQTYATPPPLAFGPGDVVFCGRQLWDAKNKRLRGNLRADVVRAVAFHPTEPLVAVGRENANVLVMSTDNLDVRHEVQTAGAPASALAFRPDGAALAVGLANGAAGIVNAKDWRIDGFVRFQLPDEIRGVAFHGSAGTLTATDGRRARARRGEAAGQEVVIALDGRNNFRGPLIAFSPDGEMVVSGSGKEVGVRDARTGAVVRTWTTAGTDVHDACFSPDGRLVAATTSPTTCYVWNLASGETVHQLKGPGAALRLAFDGDSPALAVAYARAAVVYDLRTGAVVRSFPYPSYGVAVAFTPGRSALATSQWLNGSSDPDSDAVALWDLTTGAKLFGFRPHGGGSQKQRACSLRFFADGRRFLTASADKTVRLWDGPDKEVRTFRGHEGEVYTAALSPDERRLATASEDGTVRVWDVETGIDLLTFRNGRRGVYGVAFSPDGTRLASSGGDGTVRVWDSSPGNPPPGPAVPPK